MDKKAKLLDRLQNLAIAVLSLSFLFLLVQTPLFGDAGDTTIASTVRGWFTDRRPPPRRSRTPSPRLPCRCASCRATTSSAAGWTR